LFFGNRTDIPETWDQWTFHKLQTPRIYQTKDVEQLMPNFDFDKADINNLVVFLASLTQGTVQERYRMPGSEHQTQIVAGGEWSITTTAWDATLSRIAAATSGALLRRRNKLRAANTQWRGFQGSARVAIHVPPGSDSDSSMAEDSDADFPLHQREDDSIVNYFTAMSDVNVPYMFINTNLIPPAELQAGAKLMTKDYFNCFSCHQQATRA